MKLVVLGWIFMSRVLISLVLTISALATPRTNYPLVPQDPLSQPIILTVTITDKHGNYVRGLSRDLFEVLDQGKPQQVTDFDDHDSPAAVGIVFDLSASMNPDAIRSGREALGNLVGLSHPETEFFLVGVSTHSALLQDWTRDGATLSNAVPMIPPKMALKGNTAFYDACYLGVQKLLSHTYRKRVLFVLSDGQDNNSKHTFLELKRFLEASGVMLYSVGVFNVEYTGSSLGEEGRGILDELSSVTGAWSYVTKREAEIDKAFRNIATELRNQYTVTFQPDRKSLPDNRRHTLKVRIKTPPNLPKDLRDVKVRARHSYYPPTNT